MNNLSTGVRLLRMAAAVSFITLAPVLVARADHKSNPSDNHNGGTGAPIDGGASLLLAGGVAYAIRRVRQARKKAKAL